MNRWPRRCLIGLTIIGLGGAILLGWLLSSVRQPLELQEPVIIEVTPGMSLQRLGDWLAGQGLIRFSWQLTVPGRWDGSSRTIQAGEYRLEPGMRPTDVLELLSSGRTVQHPVVLVEGWRVSDALQSLWRNEVVRNTLQGLEEQDILDRLDLPWPALEGAFFPDTYHVIRGTTDADVLQRAADRLQGILEAEWPQRAVALPYESPYDALIMASIVEKESGFQQEMPSIAGVFIRRLQHGMRLQSDPTVIYGAGDEYDGNISRSHLETTTPYNTYRISGLPPTPIAMAGLGAIRASLHPAEEPYLYFVSRGDGTHQFSETLEEHNAAVRQFILRTPEVRDEATP